VVGPTHQGVGGEGWGVKAFPLRVNTRSNLSNDLRRFEERGREEKDYWRDATVWVD